MKLNKELYENIMYNVSRQLKKALNEAALDDKETLAYNNLMDFF